MRSTSPSTTPRSGYAVLMRPIVLASLVLVACGSSTSPSPEAPSAPPTDPDAAAKVTKPATPKRLDPAFCEPARTEGFRSEMPCVGDDDCVECQCAPVNRAEWDRRGGAEACTDPHAECIATNAVCCDGKCMLAR